MKSNTRKRRLPGAKGILPLPLHRQPVADIFSTREHGAC